MRRKILRPLSWLLVGVTATGVLLSGAIRVDQYLLRWRAERLQADIRSLELRKSTYPDARRIEEHWLDESKEGVCRPSWCDLEIFLRNTGSRHVEFFLSHPTVGAIYRRLGGRAAGAGAFIQVRDSLVWGKGISLGIDTSSTEPDGRRTRYDLEGTVGTDLPIASVSARHPEYQIGGPTGCLGCKAGWVKFTPFADPRDVLRLTDLGFACITIWRQCTEQADILPTAWKELRAEIAERAETLPNPCTPVIIRSLSRQTHRVELLKVIKLESEGERRFMTVRRLPGGAPLRPDEWREFSLPANLIGLGRVNMGEQFLLFDNGTCRAVPATPENLDTARLGAGEAWINPAHPLGLPFGTIARPKIDVR